MIAAILLTALVLAIAGVALYFAFQNAKREAAADRAKLINLVRVTNARAARRIKRLENQVETLESRADREEGTIKPVPNLYSKSEQRHIDQAKKMPSVLGVVAG